VGNNDEDDSKDGGCGKRWWEQWCDVAVFEPWLPNLIITNNYTSNLIKNTNFLRFCFGWFQESILFHDFPFYSGNEPILGCIPPEWKIPIWQDPLPNLIPPEFQNSPGFWGEYVGDSKDLNTLYKMPYLESCHLEMHCEWGHLQHMWSKSPFDQKLHQQRKETLSLMQIWWPCQLELALSDFPQTMWRTWQKNTRK
jgi:hypothetical protein